MIPDRGHGALGGVVMALTMALYTANDTLVKLLGAAMPLGQIISLRGLLILLIGLALTVFLPGHGPASLKWLGDRGVIIRSIWDTAVTILYLTALMHMPIANILAIMNLSPLAIIPLAAWLLGEKVGARRIAAVIAGFLGALLVVRPGTEGFNIWALLAFLAMLGVAGRDLATRNIPRRPRPWWWRWVTSSWCKFSAWRFGPFSHPIRQRTRNGWRWRPARCFWGWPMC